jgi:hypothetical protein
MGVDQPALQLPQQPAQEAPQQQQHIAAPVPVAPPLFIAPPPPPPPPLPIPTEPFLFNVLSTSVTLQPLAHWTTINQALITDWISQSIAIPNRLSDIPASIINDNSAIIVYIMTSLYINNSKLFLSPDSYFFYKLKLSQNNSLAPNVYNILTATEDQITSCLNTIRNSSVGLARSSSSSPAAMSSSSSSASSSSSSSSSSSAASSSSSSGLLLLFFLFLFLSFLFCC